MKGIKDKINPLVSIITPSYNQGQFIEDTILSVKNQNYPNIEHIIVDGGSTDNSLDIIKKYENTYNLRWISEPDEGQTEAINKGFKMAQGKVIGWLNSDDIYFKRNVISNVVKLLSKKKKIKILYGDAILIDQHNNLLRIECLPDFDYFRLVRGCYIIQPSVFFRDSIIKNYELNEKLKFVMDYEYWLRIGKKIKIYHVPILFAGDRYHSKRKIIAKRSLMQKESIEIKKRYGMIFNIKSILYHLKDKLISTFLRLKGLQKIYVLNKENNYTIKISFDNLFRFSIRQLCIKNRNLVDGQINLFEIRE